MENVTEQVAKIEEDTKEFINTAKMTEVIQDNAVEFKIADIQYRVKRPTFEQKQLAVQERTKKFISLLKDPNQMLEKDLVALYEARGINVKELDTKLEVLQKQRNDFMMKLGQGLTEKERSKEELDTLKTELEGIILEQNKLLMQKSVYLDSTIESQVNVFIYTYLASLITEKYTNDNWVRAWDSYESFTKEVENVVNNVIWNVALVSKNELPTM